MLRALIIDDDLCIHDLARLALETHGWQVFTAASAEDAIPLARDQHPDVILLDLQMPITDGAAILKCLKNDADLRNIPVILMTADSVSDQSNSLDGLPVAGWLAKPFSPKDLSGWIDEKLR